MQRRFTTLVIVASFVADLPGKALAAADPPLEPLRIRYFRADEKAAISAVAALCKRQLENCEERTMPDGAWLDGCHADSESSRKVSIDVVVCKLVPNAPFTAGQAQNLVIEVLCVETVGSFPSRSRF